MDAIYVIAILALVLALAIPLAGLVRTLMEMFGFDIKAWWANRGKRG